MSCRDKSYLDKIWSLQRALLPKSSFENPLPPLYQAAFLASNASIMDWRSALSFFLVTCGRAIERDGKKGCTILLLFVHRAR